MLLEDLGGGGTYFILNYLSKVNIVGTMFSKMFFFKAGYNEQIIFGHKVFTVILLQTLANTRVTALTCPKYVNYTFQTKYFQYAARFSLKSGKAFPTMISLLSKGKYGNKYQEA